MARIVAADRYPRRLPATIPTVMRLLALALIGVVLAPSRAAVGQDPATEAQIREGLSRRGRGEVAFQDAVRLVDLIDLAAQTVSSREAQARFALYRLQSMRNAAAAIEGGREIPSYAETWVEAHGSELMYFESAGDWLLNSLAISKIHDTWRDTAAADDIAWLRVENGWPGECEGYVPCYIGWQNGLNGEYLRLHPRGRHADAANRDITRTLDSIMDHLAPMLDALFHSATECGELNANLDPLVAAIRASRSPAKAPALAATDRFARLCRRR
jgi:hypothetical protein